MGISLLLLFTWAVSLFFGSYTFEAAEWWYVITGETTNELASYVLYELRLPRVTGAALVGALMAVSGSAMQGLFRNPLADPGLIGVASGAAMFAVIGIASGLGTILAEWGIQMHLTLPVMAFCGALVAALLPLRFAGKMRSGGMALLLLLGICIQFFTGAVTSAVFYLADNEALRSITFWLMGSFSGVQWPMIWPLAITAVITFSVLQRNAQSLNLLTLGEDHAISSGVHIRKVRFSIILTTALAVGVSVAVAGAIGFIGLIAPHFARLVIGHDHRVLLPAAALSGALVAVSADTVARSLFAPEDLPVGILTAVIGTITVFTILLNRRKETLSL